MTDTNCDINQYYSFGASPTVCIPEFTIGGGSVNVQVCFAAGTPVLFADGSTKAIETIKVGDMVLSRHHENPTGEVLKCQVVRVFQNGPKKTYKLTFENGLTIQATPEHPFYVKDQGWVSCETLEPGTTCVSAENTPQVLVAKVLDLEPVPVYNLEVENATRISSGTPLNKPCWCIMNVL